MLGHSDFGIAGYLEIHSPANLRGAFYLIFSNTSLGVKREPLSTCSGDDSQEGLRSAYEMEFPCSVFDLEVSFEEDPEKAKGAIVSRSLLTVVYFMIEKWSNREISRR